MATDPEPFVFDLTDCFTIRGRGTVVVGEIASGSVHTGDQLDLVHDGITRPTKCLGVEMGHGRDPQGKTFHFIGLLLEGVDAFEVKPGDRVTSVR